MILPVVFLCLTAVLSPCTGQVEYIALIFKIWVGPEALVDQLNIVFPMHTKLMQKESDEVFRIWKTFILEVCIISKQFSGFIFAQKKI